MTTTPGNAVATRDNGPRELVAAYTSDFRQVVPSHVRVDQWVRLAQGALKKGKKVPHPVTKKAVTELELAAANNPGVFLASLLDAARLGLEPGTEQYYLTPRKVGGRLEILGIVGYQGYIELMYRAGAVASVVAEVVYERDVFQYRPGVDERPHHEIDWDAADRGGLRLTYAYAVMKDGATSKVVVLNRIAIETIKKSSASANGDRSPWKTHEPSMWLKSAVRQLAKWVPTSAEYRRELARTERMAPEHVNSVEIDLGVDDTPRIPVEDLPQIPVDDFVDAEIIDGDTDPADAGPSDATAGAPAAADPAMTPGTRAWHDAKHPREIGPDGEISTVDVLNSGDCGICEQGEAGGT